MAIKTVTKEDEIGDKNIDTIVEDKLQTPLRSLTHLQEEIMQDGEDTTFHEGRKITESVFIAGKAMIAKATMLAFPDFSKPFDIYTDSSDYQLGSVLS